MGFVKDYLRRSTRVKRIRERVRRLIDPPMYKEFSIGMYEGPSPVRLRPVEGLSQPVIAPDDVDDFSSCLVADPFMLHRNGRWHMFFEVLRAEGEKGRIARADSPDGIRWRYRGVVLSESFHLSYPHVFVSGDDVYMIPESYQAGEVRLYRATRFPDEWAFEACLLEGGPYVDASVFEHEDRWWMFIDGSPDLSCSQLNLFYASELLGPWIEHPLSPVRVEDKQYARPAGRVVRDGGRIIRFAQKCEPLYGLSVSAFEIFDLSERTYEERALGSAILEGSGDPGAWNEGGMHHVDAHLVSPGRWVACVDGWRHRRERRW